MNIKNAIIDNGWENLFFKGVFGMEKEAQRITADGKIARTDHPAVFGKRSFHPYIQTDFAESQLELITPPVESLEEMLEWQAAIHDVALRSIPEDEYLLSYSVPPIMPEEDDIQIAKLEKRNDVVYREHLASVYGKRKQMVSGIHFNFEFNRQFIGMLKEAMDPEGDEYAFQTDLYLKLVHNFFRYQWVLTYLYGCSVEAKDSYFREGRLPEDVPAHYIRSLRSSKYGYVNGSQVKVSYRSMEEYVRTLEEMVAAGHLSEEREFYSTVRFRGGKSARDIMEKGISYLEFRLFDLNPFAPLGILAKDLRFIHCFLMYLVWMEEEGGEAEEELGRQMNYRTAFEYPLAVSAYQEEGLRILSGMQEMLQALRAPAAYVEVVEEQERAFHEPARTLAGTLVQLLEKGTDSLELAIGKAKEFKALAWERPYALRGFTDMELSTQILLFDAIQKGLEIEILDRTDQFLSLTHQGHREYVKNGNMTAKDTYIAPLIMENKVVTKKILAQHGFAVPASQEYHSLESAWADAGQYREKAIVIKPKSTNYGLGITIFRHGTSEANFKKAVEIAFQEDDTVLVEDFVKGTEYRFFVINGETRAVLLRIPANVEGDGIHTIRELVEAKNEDSLRGIGHRSPLEKIQLGDIERLTLQEQGYTIESVPARGERVWLRDNSNVSTGGDSVDFTEAMDPSYKQLAGEMAMAVGAAIAGMDMMILDHTKPSTAENPGYGVIEANFNPMMMMHIYPYKGKGQRLTLDVLQLLFPEMEILSGRHEGEGE